VASLYRDSFKRVARASLVGSSARAYFKVQGYPGYPVIISRFEYGASEKIQVVEAFKEYIHLYAFGRAASQVQIQGHCLNIGDDFAGSAVPLKAVYQLQLRAFKTAQQGGLIGIVGPIGVLKGVAANLSFSIMGGQDGLLNFGMSFIVLDGSSESSVGTSQGSGSSSSSENTQGKSSNAQTSAENEASQNAGGNSVSKLTTSAGNSPVWAGGDFSSGMVPANSGSGTYSFDSKGQAAAWET